MDFVSRCVKGGRDTRTTEPHQLPIYASSSFVLDTVEQGIDIFKGNTKGHVYGRYANPTIDAVTQRIAELEAIEIDQEAYGILTSSGMSAISTIVLGLLKSGDAILTQGNLYGGTTELFKKVMKPIGIDTIFESMSDLHELEKVVHANSNIKLLYLETPANPTMACVDLEALSAFAKEYQLITVIDNTFCTPYIQRPLSLGIDFVIHSTTKYLNGHGNGIAGIIVGHKKEFYQKIWQAMKLLGTNSNPFDAWLLNNGLKTLALRMDQHSFNSLELAKFLETHPKVLKVNHLGLSSHSSHEIAKKQMTNWGGMMSFEINGSVQDGIDFINRLQFCTQAPTLGDVDTLVLHPATSSHLNVDRELRIQNGITDGLIRLSVGIEKIDDIIADVDQALQQV